MVRIIVRLYTSDVKISSQLGNQLRYNVWNEVSQSFSWLIYVMTFLITAFIRGTAVTSRILAPTEKAEVIQVLDYGVNRSLVTITGNGYSLKQILSSIKIMIYCQFRFVNIETIILFSLNYHCQYHWLYDYWYITYFSSAWRGVCLEIFRHINIWYPHKDKIIGTYIEIKQFHVL